MCSWPMQASVLQECAEQTGQQKARKGCQHVFASERANDWCAVSYRAMTRIVGCFLPPGEYPSVLVFVFDTSNAAAP